MNNPMNTNDLKQIPSSFIKKESSKNTFILLLFVILHLLSCQTNETQAQFASKANDNKGYFVDQSEVSRTRLKPIAVAKNEVK